MLHPSIILGLAWSIQCTRVRQASAFAYLAAAGGLAPRRLLPSSKPVAKTVICSSPSAQHFSGCMHFQGELSVSARTFVFREGGFIRGMTSSVQGCANNIARSHFGVESSGALTLLTDLGDSSETERDGVLLGVVDKRVKGGP